MKNIIMLVVFVTTIFPVIYAQQENDSSKESHHHDTGAVRFGLKAGYTQAKIVGSDVNHLSNAGNIKPLNGFHAGITVNSELSRFFWLKHDLLFYRQGAVLLRDNEPHNPYRSNLIINTFTLMPISPTFHHHGIQLYGGPYMSFVSSAGIQRKNEEGELITDHSFFGSAEQQSPYAQKFDFGIVAGLEYEFCFGLSIGTRFQRGFFPIIENANSINPDTGKITPQSKIFNQSFSLSIGYTFGKNKK